MITLSKVNTFIVGILFIATTSSVYAQTEKKKNLQSEVESFNVTLDKNVTKNSDIENNHKITKNRNRYRTEADILTLKKSMTQNKVDLYKTEIEANNQQFIKENVPTSVILSGDESVRQYIKEHFIDNKNPQSTGTTQVKEIWSGDVETLSLPNSAVNEIKPITITQKKTPVLIPIKSDKKINDIKTKKKTIDEVKSLDISKEDMLNIINKQIQKEKQKHDDSKKIETRILISEIKPLTYYEMGKVKQVSVEITFKLISSNANAKKTITKTFNDISDGYSFFVNDFEFKLQKLNSQNISILNIKDGSVFNQNISI